MERKAWTTEVENFVISCQQFVPHWKSNSFQYAVKFSEDTLRAYDKQRANETRLLLYYGGKILGDKPSGNNVHFQGGAIA